MKVRKIRVPEPSPQGFTYRLSNPQTREVFESADLADLLRKIAESDHQRLGWYKWVLVYSRY